MLTSLTPTWRAMFTIAAQLSSGKSSGENVRHEVDQVFNLYIPTITVAMPRGTSRVALLSEAGNGQ